MGGGGIAIAALTFTKRERIVERSDIDRIFNEGRKYSCRGMRIHVVPNGLQLDRVVFITVRSYPGAVERNRARRVLRECWRLCGPERLGGHDVVVVLYPGVDEFGVRQRQLQSLLAQAGLFGRRS